MSAGHRVTDEVAFFRRRGEIRRAVRTVRGRTPERLRWRIAVNSVTHVAGQLAGRERMFVEEPVRELVLDLDDRILRREVALDARRNGVDLDRGEIFAFHDVWAVRRIAFLTGVDLNVIGQYVRLPDNDRAPVDTGAVIVVGRAMADVHRRRSQKLMLRVPQGDHPLMRHEQYMLERAQRDADLARRWTALAQTMCAETR